MTIIRVYWREAPDGNAESSWTDVVKYAWQDDGDFWFKTPTGTDHYVSRAATQLITIQEK